ncbi:MAG: DUF5666 domain-containing protein [Thermoanaerobaculia bacterium]
MKRVAVAVIAVIAMLVLGACHGKEQAMTGSYGDGVVTGQVVMTEGGSPAGVNVSVSGTGMTRTVGDDGQFAFGGVPDGAELVFERASDGIAATLKLTTATGHVVVDLTKSEAKKSGRRRAAGPSKTFEFEGLLTTVGATEIVMNSSRAQGVTIALTDQTIIRRGGTPLTAADLAVDMRVHVKATQTATGGYSAVQIVVQDGDDDDDDQPAAREYEGIVVSATATELVIYSSHKAQVTFVLNAATEIRKGNTPVLAADILPGSRVHVKSTASADGATNTANLVTVQNTKGGDDDGDDDDAAPKAKLSGDVTAVGATELTVQTGVGSITVKTDAATRIKKRGSTIALAQVLVGDKVKVEGTRNTDGSVLAKSIEVKSK